MKKNTCFSPEYYKDFECLASQCHDNCCIGWEIDIDRKTLNKYKKIQGELGVKLKENIVDDGIAHFKLKENGRCPFLSNDNLCEIIIEKGEKYLCDICKNHPRFFNEYEDYIECSVGLACESACKLILDSPTKRHRLNFPSDIEKSTSKIVSDFLNLREQLFDIIDAKCYTVPDVMLKLIQNSAPDIDFKGEEFDVSANDFAHLFQDCFGELEYLDSDCKEMLKQCVKFISYGDLSHYIEFLNTDFKEHAKRLLYYFIFRYTFSSIFDFSLLEKCSFSILSVLTIALLVFLQEKDIYSISHIYSKNIEYSENNVSSLCDTLADKNSLIFYNFIRSQFIKNI